ncbi:hypothetical protein ACEWY4_005060 [Coilia grayii]|uniref:Usherin n=1 Tax=Coilia grayii TaxID=363190 RepID=A0ABD1KHG8_9TELE
MHGACLFPAPAHIHPLRLPQATSLTLSLRRGPQIALLYISSSSAIQLTWGPPDSPNSNALTYQLNRDNQTIHTIHSYYPFNSMIFEDDGLSPYEAHTYQLLTSNVQGNTSSVEVTYRTMANAPTQEDLVLLQQGRAKPHSASFNWTVLDKSAGRLERFVLSSVEGASGDGTGGEGGSGVERVHYTGLQTEATARGLRPFTRYTFTLQACTSGGCGRSDRVVVVTAQIPPLHQAPPRVRALGPGAVEVDWDPPEQPNGIIIRYELFMRGPLQSPDNDTDPLPEERAFLSRGWLNPKPLIRSSNDNALSPPQSSTNLTNLEPYSWYAFRVLTVNMAGSVVSDWVTQRTPEDVPVYMPPPEVTPLTSTSLRVTWGSPSDRDARGNVTEFRVNIHEEQSANPFAPPVLTRVLHTASALERSYTAVGLQPYRPYNFTITLCNAQGCVDSDPTSGRTLPAVPEEDSGKREDKHMGVRRGRVRPDGLSSPKLTALNMTAIAVSWAAPRELNGPPPTYQLERTDVSLSDPFDPVVRGVRFPGHGYFRFPNFTLPVNTDFTGLQLSFRTRALNGLILCALSPGHQEEYVALQIQNGRPFFLFDPQASAVALSPQGDGGRSYSDGQWHHVIATRKQAVGTIIVDNQYRGDARLVTQGFVGCLRDVLVQRVERPLEEWEPLRWESALEEVNTYHSWEGCPTHRDEGAHFLGQGYLELKREIFSGGQDFQISFEFKTDQLNAMLLFAYDTDGEDYIMAEVEGGILTWTLQWGGGQTQVSLWVGLSYCDGSWNSLSLAKRGAQAFASLNHASEQERAPRAGLLKVTSPLYLGGIPLRLHHHVLTGRSHLHGFGGCVKDLRFGRGPGVSLLALSSDAVRVDLDGCLSADSSVHCRGNDSILVYTGPAQDALDLAVQPFTVLSDSAARLHLFTLILIPPTAPVPGSQRGPHTGITLTAILVTGPLFDS